MIFIAHNCSTCQLAYKPRFFFIYRFFTVFAEVSLCSMQLLAEILPTYSHTVLFTFIFVSPASSALNPAKGGLVLKYRDQSGFGGLEVACWTLVPKFAGSNPTEAFLSTPSFGKEVKPFFPRRIFAACKRTRKCMRGSRRFRSKLQAISRPSSSSFHY